MNYITEKLEELHRYLKTNELVKMLAAAPEHWTQEECDIAIMETGSLPFCVADVEFLRALDRDERYAHAQEKLKICFLAMAKMPLRERQTFWEETAKPLQEEANRRRSDIRARFRVKLYAEGYEIGGTKQT